MNEILNNIESMFLGLNYRFRYYISVTDTTIQLFLALVIEYLNFVG